MNPPIPGWKQITSREPVHIPDATGAAVSETIWVDVLAWQDPATGEVFLDGDARKKLETVKARYLGVLCPHHLKDLREAVGVTQKEMAELLQLGEKSWTRWESGAERPSRSSNVMLCALYDGRIDVSYLRSLADPTRRTQFQRWKPSVLWEDGAYGEPDNYTWSGHEDNAVAS